MERTRTRSASRAERRSSRTCTAPSIKDGSVAAQVLANENWMAIAVTYLILQQHGLLMAELLVLCGEDLRRLMRFEDYIDAVAAAFALHADGKSFAPAPVQIPGSAEGTFHIKAASLP